MELLPLLIVALVFGLIFLLTRLGANGRQNVQRAMLAKLSERWRGGEVKDVIALGYSKPMPGFEVTVEGRRAVVFGRAYGSTDYYGFQLETAPLPLAVLRRERWTDKLGRALWLNREVQTGDKDFDAKVYIETDEDPEVIKAMLAPDAARAAILAAAEHYVDVVTSREGVGVIVRTTPKFRDPQERFNAVLPRVRAVADALPAAVGGAGVRRSARGDLAAGAAVMVFFAGYMVRIVSQWMKPDLWEPYLTADEKAVSRIAGLSFLALLVLSYGWMRGHSRSLRNFALTGIFGGFAVLLTVPTLLSELNATLDHSAPVPHETMVISKRSRSSRYYTHRIVVFRSLFTPNSTGALDVDRVTWNRVHPGDTIRVSLRDGAFGWKWVSGTEFVSAAPPGTVVVDPTAPVAPARQGGVPRGVTASVMRGSSAGAAGP